MGAYYPNGGLPKSKAILRLLLFNTTQHPPNEIGKAGERAVASQLESLGYGVDRNTQGPGATDIFAVGNGRVLLVQVKTAQSPRLPDSVSAEDARRIRARAAHLRAEPWEAKVQLNWLLEPIDEIGWKNLN